MKVNDLAILPLYFFKFKIIDKYIDFIIIRFQNCFRFWYLNGTKFKISCLSTFLQHFPKCNFDLESFPIAQNPFRTTTERWISPNIKFYHSSTLWFDLFYYFSSLRLPSNVRHSPPLVFAAMLLLLLMLLNSVLLLFLFALFCCWNFSVLLFFSGGW